MWFMLQQPLYDDVPYIDPREKLNTLTKDKLIDFIIQSWLQDDPILVRMLEESSLKWQPKEITKQNSLLIKELKEKANELKITYIGTKERIFANHINTAKEFGALALKYWLSRIDYAKAIMQLGKMINSIYPYYGPMDIYRNHWRILNEYERKKKLEEDKKNNKKVYNKVSKIKF